MSRYEGQCGSCLEFEFEGDNRKGYCEWHKMYLYPTDSCRHQRERYTPSSSTCYITTIVCHILGNRDDCAELEQLRKFRNEVMQPNEEYREMLYEYDAVGPQIAGHLYQEYVDSHNKEFATQLFNSYIQPTAHLVSIGNYEEAVSRYQKMTKDLEECYGIIPPEKVAENYDAKQGGHGKVKQKIQENL